MQTIINWVLCDQELPEKHKPLYMLTWNDYIYCGNFTYRDEFNWTNNGASYGAQARFNIVDDCGFFELACIKAWAYRLVDTLEDIKHED